MARIRLELPDRLPFETEMRVRISDVNYGGHLGNDAVLSLVHEARVRFLAAHGFTELDLGGPGILMTDCAILYRAEGRYGQRVRVEVGVGDFGERRFDLYYRLTDADAGTVLAEAKTGIVAYDYEARETCAVPDRVREALAGPPAKHVVEPHGGK